MTNREKFEAWAQRHHGVYSIGGIDGMYSNPKVANDWFVWQAAIASVIVELPSTDCMHSADEYVDVVEMALESAGIKYK